MLVLPQVRLSPDQSVIIARIVVCLVSAVTEVIDRSGMIVIAQNKKLEMNCGADGLHITLTLLQYT